MSGKQEKKLRQLYKRDLEAKVDAEITQLKADFKNLLKPPPKYLPIWLYIKLQRLFLNV